MYSFQQKGAGPDNQVSLVIGPASLRPAVLVQLWSYLEYSREIPLYTSDNKASVELGWNHRGFLFSSFQCRRGNERIHLSRICKP